ncbi:hypothetical protein HJC23_000047 [Cyclotella cryptica]|uniref:C3H1-type domain-containing protein n=1 Tax=Cyclotella cryptica TaxID=29204 RepID=A0ABD3NUU6_9STRA
MQTSFAENSEMRTDPLVNHQGELGSPHISRMEGDLSKINPLEHRDARSSEYAQKDSQSFIDTRDSSAASIDRRDGSHGLTKQSYQAGSTMIRPSPQPASWSNVVSSTSPIKFTRSSDETILTSNTAASTHPNFEYTNQRPRSFDANDGGSSLSYLPQSIGVGHQTMTPTRPQNAWGMPLPHPPSTHSLPTINQGVQGPSTPLHSPMMYSTQHHTMECFSPLSLCDSTDQTTPLSSPSMSPHVTPLQMPIQNHQEPPMWQLTPSPSNLNIDSNDYHSPSVTQRFRPPEPIRNFYQQGTANHQGYGHPRAPQAYMHPSPVAPAYPLGALWFAPQRKFSRLSFEKACLYEPDTSSAVALVTWFVGRRLAISHGFFSRQQLQSGVHSCVASKIKEGRVTRTKVNRCMQIILNSCFHYIIPRSDGSEESGDLFRKTFLHDAVNDEHLVKTLPPPWNDLNLDALNVEEGSVDAAEGSDDDASHHSPKNHGNHSSSASQAGESVDSTKRSVLLCFNENIRSAADVFRCHNEFIRDVAHSANLNLSIEDWKVFFSGSKNYRKIMLSTESAAQSYFNFVGGTSSDGNDRMDQQGLAKFHTSWCAKRYEHDHSLCTFAHVEINRGWLRRDPFIYNYKPVLCSGVIPLQSSGDCFLNVCPHGINCGFAHSKEEILYHPVNYKKNPCKSPSYACSLRDICPYTHVGPNSHGQSTGFMKRPDGSPMLYIDPAPVSDFEGTLLLPGLQAIFRDYSNSVFNSLCKDKTREYGLFGYKQSLPQKLSNEVRLAPIGKMESSKSVSDLGYQN